MTLKNTTLFMLLLAVSLAGCDAFLSIPNPPTTTTVQFDQTLYDRGVAIYLESYCGSCHELDAAGSFGNFGPSHNQAGILAAERLGDPNYDGDATTPEGYLRESIVDPLVYFTPTYAGSAHRMPAYTNLSDEELDALVYLLINQDE